MGWYSFQVEEIRKSVANGSKPACGSSAIRENSAALGCVVQEGVLSTEKWILVDQLIRVTGLNA